MTMGHLRAGIGFAILTAGSLGLSGLASSALADTQPLFPKVDCATVNTVTHTVVVSLGVDNQTSTVITNPLNVFSPSSPGLPTTFVPGYTPSTFKVTISDSQELSWFLGQTTYPVDLKPPYTQVSYDGGSTFYPVRKCPKGF